MSPVLFTYLLWVMSFLAIVVFICLYFITAGYGQFRTKRWGYSIDNRVAWFLMEAPVFFVMLIIWCRAGFPFHLPELILLGLFLVHYFQRSFVFPCLMKGHSRMPLSIMMMGILFNVINGIMQGGGLFWFPIPAYAQDASYLLRWNTIVGIIVFLFGMIVNWHSDYVIRHLRQPGDTRHFLPQAGFYRYVTSANYFGELVEWIGFAIAAANPAAWVFALWTGANLIPRAHAIHRKYHEEFGDEAVGTRRRIIPLVY
jgi:3-oxo-5-alpha-steroid 4-dehydrogenase 1